MVFFLVFIASLVKAPEEHTDPSIVQLHRRWNDNEKLHQLFMCILSKQSVLTAIKSKGVFYFVCELSIN